MSLLGTNREIRVYIVDTDPEHVQLLQTYFHSEALRSAGETPLRCVGVAYTGQDCQREVQSLSPPPDVFVINAHLPDISGIELIKRLNLIRTVTNPLVVMLLPDGFHHLALPAQQAGAAAVLNLPCTLRDVENAIRRVFADRLDLRAQSAGEFPGAQHLPPAPPEPDPAGWSPEPEAAFDAGTGASDPLDAGFGDLASPGQPGETNLASPAAPMPADFRQSPDFPAREPEERTDWAADERPGATRFRQPPSSPVHVEVTLPSELPQRKRPPRSVKGGRKTVAAFASKGGVGKTTILSNLAVTIAIYTDIPLLVADLDLDNPSLHAHWFVDRNDFDLSDLRDVKDRLDRHLLQKILYPYRFIDPTSGKRQRQREIQFLPGFVKQLYVDDFTEEDVDRLLSVMQEISPLLLLDLSNHLSNRVVARVIEQCTHLILVLDQDMTAVDNTVRFLELLRRHEPQFDEKVIAVINKLVPYGASVSKIEKALGLKVEVTIPFEHKLFLTAITDAKPVVLEHFQEPIAKPFFELAEILVPSLRQSAQRTPGQSSILSRLFPGFGRR